MRIDLTTLIVANYDEAIAFYCKVLGFQVAEDESSTTNDGRPKRWVVVRPPGGGPGLLLAKADGARQAEAIGQQWAGRVGLFLRVDDFESAHQRLVDNEVTIVRGPRSETYGEVLIFEDIAGNRWDLLGPRP